MSNQDEVDARLVKAICDRLFPYEGPIRFQRMQSGGSTQVFQLDGADGRRFLRFAEDADASLAPEAWVHDRLYAMGARVPNVLVIDEHPPEIDRSIMVTAAVPGFALASRNGPKSLHDADIRRALFLAGQDLAQIHSIPVEGFGFIRRGATWNGTLSAPFRSIQAWNRSMHIDPLPLETYFSGSEYQFLMRTIESASSVEAPTKAVLAHGDFDATHIFVDGGGYSGIIDFGEIRGADRWFDLAHFRAVSSIECPHSGFAGLTEGYSTIYQLSDDDLVRIDERAIVVGCSILQRIRGRGLKMFERSLIESIRMLLDVHDGGFR